MPHEHLIRGDIPRIRLARMHAVLTRLTSFMRHRTSLPVLTTQRCSVCALITVLLLCTFSCRSASVWSGASGSADFAVFQAEVYPVLMRDCGFSNCHGLELRAFQVWGPGRSRLDTRDSDIVAKERTRTYTRALSLLYTDGSRPLMESPLLTKPLENSAGGATHGGVDRYGRNVYRSQAEPGFQALARWATTQSVMAQTATVSSRAAGSAGGP
jgi:hypothetical protein